MNMKKALMCLVLALCCGVQNSNALEVKVMSAGGAAAWSAPVIGMGVGAFKIFTWFFDPNRILNAAGKEAAILALQNIPAPQNAMVASDALIACNIILFWLPANGEQTTEAVNLYISQQFQGVNPIFLGFMEQVAATLERYVPVGSTFLNPTYMQYVISFITGLKTGIVQWQMNPQVHVKVKYTTAKQREHEIKKMKLARAASGWFRPVVNAEVVSPCEPCK